MTTFTKEEELQFTTANAIAYDLLRFNDPETTHPCWLCMSDAAKYEARLNTVEWLNINANPLFPVNYKTLDAFCERKFKDSAKDLVEIWKDVELAAKKERELNNPLAFFMFNKPHKD
jgi:hypothetical protein